MDNNPWASTHGNGTIADVKNESTGNPCNWQSSQLWFSADLFCMFYVNLLKIFMKGGGAWGAKPPTRIKCARECARFDSSIYIYMYICVF